MKTKIHETKKCMKMEFKKGSVCFLETLVFIFQTAWRHLTVDVPMLLIISEVWVCIYHITKINF